LDDNSWNYESRMYNNPNYNGQNESMHPFINGDVPPLISKNSDMQYPRTGVPPSQGMMGNNMSGSPESMSPTGKSMPQYFPFSKRQLEDVVRGRRPSPGGKRQKPVYSPNPDEYGQDSPRYTSPKPPIYGDPQPPHSSADPWSNNGLPPSSYPSSMLQSNSSHSQASSYSNMHHPDMGGYPISPNQENILSGLPSMNTFRGQVPTTSSYSTTSPTVNGSELNSRRNQSSSQTGDALGKALASIYPTDHTGSNYGSNPSTPVSSPPPITGSSSQWQQRPSAQNITTSQHIDGPGPLSSLSRMEERLDDAIHVLRNHAGGEMTGMPPQHMPGMIPHPNGHMSSMGYPPHMGMSASMESHMQGGHHQGSDTTNRTQNLSSISSETQPKSSYDAKSYEVSVHEEQTPTQTESIKGERDQIEKADSESSRSDSGSTTDKKQTTGNQQSHPPSKRSRRSNETDHEDESPESKTERERVRRQANNARERRNEPEEDESPETKLERERMRRQANNVRERVRVRDINEAFKELGQMVTLHTNNGQPLTKLMILQHAVNIITSLESQVRERNLNPKAACLKRREEEKTEDLPGRSISAEDLAQQAAMAGTPTMSQGMREGSRVNCGPMTGAYPTYITGQENTPLSAMDIKYNDMKYMVSGGKNILGSPENVPTSGMLPGMHGGMTNNSPSVGSDIERDNMPHSSADTYQGGVTQ
ncbi:hypothetical protein ScPMuIL_003115, partial [Solemya velum]